MAAIKGLEETVLEGFKEVFDISPMVSPRTAVFPGDVPFQNDVSMSFSKGDHLALSSIRTTVHIGAHTDSPSHYDPNGVGIEQRDLKIYLGPAQVIEVQLERGEGISLDDFDIGTVITERVLFKTNSFPDPNTWNGDFNFFLPETISALSKKGVVLVGIDTPSVDSSESKSLLAHTEICRCDMGILEGIVLDKIEEGAYQLLALPLKLEGADASPVRAVLLR